MKLIRMVDLYDKTHYFNPNCVVDVEELSADRSAIWLSDKMSINVKLSVHEVYGLILSGTSEE